MEGGAPWQNPRMGASVADQVLLLRRGGYTAAANALAATGELDLAAADIASLKRTYGIRHGLMLDRGQTEAADDLRALLDAIEHESSPTVLVGRVSDDTYHYLLFFSAQGDRVLAVAVPPRRVDQPAPPIGPDGVPLWDDPLDHPPDPSS